MSRMQIGALTLVLVALGFSTASCQAGPTEQAVGRQVIVEGGSYQEISVPELQEMLTAKDFPLINVHVPFQGDLPSTDATIPFDVIDGHLDQLPADRGARIVLYCRTGRMSAIAAETLAKLGFRNVYHLAGGFVAWRAADLPMADR